MKKINLLLYKLIIKNDFKKILIWLISIVGITLVSADLYPSLYETEEAILNYANIMINPAMKGLLGSAYPIDAFNHTVIFSQELLLFTLIAVAVMNIYFSIKFTKVSEEAGLIEIITSKPVNRFTYLTSSLVVIIGINLIIFLSVSIGLIIINIPSSTTLGAIIYGLILALGGLFFALVGFVATKLFNTASAAYNFSYLILLVSYLIRAIGDVGDNFISLISPLGLLLNVQVFYKNNLIYITIILLLIIILFALSLYLYKNIDFGSGIYNSSKGRTKASKFSKNSFGLIFRLEKIQILVWTVSLFILTAAFGAIFKEFEAFYEIEIVKQFLGSNTANYSEVIIIYILKIITLFSLIPALFIILKLTKEEANSFLDNIYSRLYSRIKYFLKHIIFAFLFSIIIQLIIVLGMWITGREFILEVMSFSKLIQTGLSFIPAIWLIFSLACILYSIGIKYSKIIWVYIAFIFVALYLENVLKLPKAIMYFSSFYHIDPLETNILTSTIMIICSMILIVSSLFIYKNRNLN